MTPRALVGIDALKGHEKLHSQQLTQTIQKHSQNSGFQTLQSLKDVLNSGSLYTYNEVHKRNFLLIRFAQSPLNAGVTEMHVVFFHNPGSMR